jgi:hypothetical protein
MDDYHRAQQLAAAFLMRTTELSSVSHRVE